MGDFDISQINPVVDKTTPKTGRDFKSIIKRLVIIFSIFLVVLSVILIYSFKYRNRPDDVTIGYSDKEGIVLASLAEHLGYFDEKDIKIDFRNYDDELELILALSESKIDVAFVEDLAITEAGPAGSDNKIIASVLNAEKYFFVVDTKKGIFNISSLSGQDIGVSESYKTDYWLEKGLSNSGVSKRDVVVKNYKPGKLAEELANANVTGVFTWQPYVYESETFEGAEVQQIVLPAQRDEGAYTYMITSQSYIDNHYDELKDILLSLITSEEYIENNRDITIEYLTGEWTTEKRYVSEVFSTYNFEVKISQESKATLSERYEWSKSKSRSDDEDYFIESIYYYNLLREIDPKRAEF